MDLSLILACIADFLDTLTSEFEITPVSDLCTHFSRVVEDVRDGLSRSKESAPSPEEEQFLLVFFEQVRV